MSKIAVDIDSTLYDFCSLACRVMGEMAEAPFYDHDRKTRLRNAAYATTWAEWRTPIDLVGESLWEEVVDRCHEPENILSQTPYEDANVVLWDLWDKGHEIVYVSNRNEATEAPTGRWLDDCGFPGPRDQSVTLLCHTEDKLASVRDCQYLIDDRPKTLVGFVYGDPHYSAEHTNRRAFGLVMPYNRNLTDVPNIYLAPNWPLLGAYLREKVPSATGC